VASQRGGGSAGVCPHLDRYDPLAVSELADPYPTWADARALRPVFQSSLNGLWFVTRYDDVLSAIRDPATFSSAFAAETFVDAFPTPRRAELDAVLERGFPDTSRFLLTTDAPTHTARRRFSQGAFSPGRVTTLEPTILAVAHRLCDQLDEQADADLMGQFCYALTTEVIAAIIGLDRGLATQMRQVSEDLLVLSLPSGHELSSEECDEILARVARISAMHEAIAALVLERRERPADDVLTGLVEATVDGLPMLEDADVIALVFELILAGTDTTANLIAQAVLFATGQPALWRGLAGDPVATKAVVEETLRRRGSSKGLFRVTTRDVEVEGVTIPTGSMVHLLYGSANHDETVFSSPANFRIDRANIKRHVAFGYGTHFCLGAPLARVETRIALQQLSGRFPDLSVTAAADLIYLPTMTTHTLAELPVHLSGRQPSTRQADRA
jgi:cytochrome P450